MTESTKDLTGLFLVASPQMQDPNFEKTVILMIGHDPQRGALGVDINRESPISLEDVCRQLKLEALPVLMDITKITKITGDYNNVRPYLFVDKVIGGVNFCLGLSRDDTVYVPSSALLEDIKRLTESPSQVLAILEKDVDADIYSIIKHVAKGLNLSNITLPQEINAMIDLKNYTYKGK